MRGFIDVRLYDKRFHTSTWYYHCDCFFAFSPWNSFSSTVLGSRKNCDSMMDIERRGEHYNGLGP